MDKTDIDLKFCQALKQDTIVKTYRSLCNKLLNK